MFKIWSLGIRICLEFRYSNFVFEKSMRLSIRQYALALLDIEKGMGADEARGAGERFALWLSRRGEGRKLAKIVAEAEMIARDRSNKTEVAITTAFEVDQETKGILTGYAEKLFPGKHVEAKFRSDRDIIGGMTIRSSETLYDGSIRQRLSRLKEVLN